MGNGLYYISLAEEIGKSMSSTSSRKQKSAYTKCETISHEIKHYPHGLGVKKAHNITVNCKTTFVEAG